MKKYREILFLPGLRRADHAIQHRLLFRFKRPAAHPLPGGERPGLGAFGALRYLTNRTWVFEEQVTRVFRHCAGDGPLLRLPAAQRGVRHGLHSSVAVDLLAQNDMIAKIAQCGDRAQLSLQQADYL